MYLAEANANYKEILHQVRNGGLNNWQRIKVLYDQIKHNHKRVLHQLNRETDDIDEVMNIYLVMSILFRICGIISGCRLIEFNPKEIWHNSFAYYFDRILKLVSLKTTSLEKNSGMWGMNLRIVSMSRKKA